MKIKVKNTDPDFPTLYTVSIVSEKGKLYAYMFSEDKYQSMFYISDYEGDMNNCYSIFAENHLVKSIMYLSSIEIKKRSRGKGFGSKLMEQLIKIAKESNCQAIILFANPQDINYWDKLIKFYEKFGFKNIKYINSSRSAYMELIF